ncbi:MAG TPA: hypothetical protein VKB50_29145 [Vicinamibacterales bacterium]|nr:hypothetical protein [Vicinamibacterales bacterium]
MKVFVSMWHLGSFRMYEPVLRELAARGHELHLALGRAEALGWSGALDTLVADHPTITWSRLSPPSAAFWAEVAKTLRLWADYLRYFHPDYDRTPKLKSRAGERLPRRLVRIGESGGYRDPEKRRRLLARLRALECALPPVREIEQELRERRPDLVLVTPLIYLGSSQFEVLRAALAQGIRTAFAVGSWDHLSSKALIRDMPHRVLVWNQTQRDEAVRLHGVPQDRVVVTGAQCYDQWFGRTPGRSRAAFCARVGLRDDRPFFLYVCSALFWGSPIEAEFVRTWVQRLRASSDSRLRDAAVLIRPHPARMSEWKTIDLSPFPHVTLYGSNPVDAGSKDDYFESLFYSAGVVGLNTSAFLEAAIVGKPVFTVLLPEFQENQEGVLHFHYLFSVGGGVLRASRSFEAHHTQLASVLQQPPERPGEQFVREFIRPQGLDRPATPIFCDAVEDLLRSPAPAPARSPIRFTVLRWAMHPVLRVLRAIYGAELIRDDWSRKETEHRRRHEAHRRERLARRRALERNKREEALGRARKQADREAAYGARAAARASAVEEKARLKRLKRQSKAARIRARHRADWRTRLKRHAVSWLRRVRSGDRGQAA